MGHIVLAWELGRNLGHLLKLLPIAKRLQARGHRVTFCLKDLSRVAPILDPLGFRYFQSPVWLPPGVGMPPPRSYADIMLRYGFLEADALAGPVHAWRHTFELLQPDLLVVEHAPSALVAARGLDVPVAMIGSGFLVPPRIDPLPPYRAQSGNKPTSLKQVNQRVLDSINRLLSADGLPKLERLSDLFAVDETFLTTVEELDHYPQRPHARYWGPIYSVDTGSAPHWPGAGQMGKRVFAYVYPGTAGFRFLIEALRGLSVASLIYAPGLSPADVRALQTDTLRFSPQPVRMSDIQQQADLIVSHGSFGTLCAALLAGKPTLMLPTQPEQAVISRRVEQQGLGLVLGEKQSGAHYRKACQQLLEEEVFTRKAQALRDRYSDKTLEDRIDAISDRCEEFLGKNISG